MFLCAALWSCQETRFLENKNCLPIGRVCEYRLDNQSFYSLHIDDSALIKNKNYGIDLQLKQELKVSRVYGELIGLNMKMPDNKFEFDNDGAENFSAKVIPGLCSENKMLWRLKISLVLSDKSKYYTFIDYQVGR